MLSLLDEYFGLVAFLFLYRSRFGFSVSEVEGLVICDMIVIILLLQHGGKVILGLGLSC